MNTTQSTAPLSATWTKLRDGSFGLRVSSEDVRPGETVTARRKDGSTSREIVGRVLWTGEGVALCTVGSSAPAPRTYGQRIQAARTTYGQRRGWGSGHGSAAPVAGYSRYCTDNETCRCYDCAS